MVSTLPPHKCRLKHVPSIDSTNEEAKRLAEAGEDECVWILADQQTHGRGRRGRVWESPAGNLMTTLYLPNSCLASAYPSELSAREGGQLSFVAGLALYDTMVHFLGRDKGVALKWPNDVIVNGAKISGLLLEAAFLRSASLGLDWLAIGFGLNLAHHPTDTPYPATSLKSEMAAFKSKSALPTNVQALGILAIAFAHYFDFWCAQDFCQIRTLWLARAKGIGQRVIVNLEKSRYDGIFVGLTEDGALTIKTERGAQMCIAAGDVYFPDARGG